MDKLEKLVKIIEDNPGCYISIDNDYWEILERNYNYDIDDDEPRRLAHSDDYQFETNWYSESNSYGIGIAEALVIILNKKGFSLKVEAV